MDVVYTCFIDPSIFVEVTTINSAVIGQSFVLQCSATMVRGITSTVDFIWTTGNTQVRRINNVTPSDLNTLIVFNDSFVIPSLDISDIGSVYECEVIMNSFPHTTVKDVFTVPFPGMYIMHNACLSSVCIYVLLCMDFKLLVLLLWEQSGTCNVCKYVIMYILVKL